MSGFAPPDAKGGPPTVKKNNVAVGTRQGVNLIEGANITLTIADDSVNNEVDVTIAAAGGGSLNITEEGGAPSAVTSIDFVGSMTTASAVGAAGTLTTVHGVQAGGTTHPDVVAAGASGFMSGADKTKLDGIATSATNGITTQDEGGAAGSNQTTLNFVGAGVTAASVGAVTTVTIPGGSSGNGVVGSPGMDGIDGEDGRPGIQGIAGTTGAQGPMGPAGIDGFDGQDGNDGSPGVNGVAGTTGSQGPVGPAIYLQAEPGDEPLYFPGLTGAAGQNGTTGAQGPIGPAGFDGFEGQDGNDGPPGANGIQGTTGAQGPIGPAIFLLGEPGDESLAFPGPPGAAGAAGSGNILTDTGWAAKGDLVAATANDTAQVVSVGTDGYQLIADSTATPGVSWQDLYNPRIWTWQLEEFTGNGASAPIGANNWAAQTNSGAVANLQDATDDADHWGLITLSTAASAAAAPVLHSQLDTLTLNGSLSSEHFWKSPTALSDGTNTYTIRIGFTDTALGTTPNQGIYLKYTHSVNSGQFQICANDGVTGETCTSGGTALVASTWYASKITTNSGYTSATLSVATPGGAYVSQGSVSTALPTGRTGPIFNIQKSLGTTARILTCDAFYMRKKISR